MKTVTIYGSAQVNAASAVYQSAFEIGRRLAQAGFQVMTGGYYGVMEAASRGAHQAGGRVIGVTTEQIGRRYQLEANAFVHQTVHHGQLRDRLLYMIENADAYLAMPGGVGTLHEIAETWELMRLAAIPTRPFVCYGQMWAELVHALQTSPYLGAGYEGMIAIAHSPDEVMAHLTRG